MQLQPVNHIGYQYFHVFKFPDGKKQEVPTTAEDYRQLGGTDPKNPKLKGAAWDYSYETLKFDTPSGFLEEGQYADVEGKYKSIYPIGEKTSFSVAMDDVTSDGTLKQSGFQKVAEEKILMVKNVNSV